jgi:peptide-methionine (S)-S-oxide reductase
MQKATFAAGCFWHVEDVFMKTKGVISTKVGFSGGKTKKPTYHQVCYSDTGHAEAVEVEFDPKIISYEKLLDVFWTLHDPTQLNRQGLDIGYQYRSAIFYYSEQQRKAAEKSKTEEQKKHKKPITTQIVKAPDFYMAEEYHQKYSEKRRQKLSKLKFW